MFEVRPSGFGIIFEIGQDESLQVFQNVLKHYFNKIIGKGLSREHSLFQSTLNPHESNIVDNSVSRSLLYSSGKNQFTTTLGHFSEMFSHNSDYPPSHNQSR
jgi:hypothetical protein